MTWGELTAIAAVILAALSPFFTAYLTRDRSRTDIQLVSTKTVREWNAARTEMQEQIDDLFQKWSTSQDLIVKIREDYERDIKKMRDEYERAIRLMQRRIDRYAAQMRRHGIEPDDTE